MASLARQFTADWEAQSRARRDFPQEIQSLLDSVLSYIHNALPEPPISCNSLLTALGDSDGSDHLSPLPDALLVNIVSRLPVKDAARTAALSRRWRPIWRSAPLVLVDAHLLPSGGDEIPPRLDRAEARTVAAAVSRILAAHPGPCRCAHLTCCYMEEDRSQVARWLQLLAVNGVEELFLINRPWPLSVDRHMPTTIFSMAALTRLYLAFWRFPDTASLPRGAAFPHLRELALCCVVLKRHDMDFILSRSPVLENLFFEGHMIQPLRLRLVSPTLRCVQIHYSNVDSVAVVDAPLLERLIVHADRTSNKQCSNTIKLGHAPSLNLIGFIEPGKHVLQLGKTTIKAGTLVNSNDMVPTVKILALQARFGVRNDAKMLPSFLRCFPNVERLHVQSKKTDEPAGKLNLKFWQEVGAIECVNSRIHLLVFHDFRGERSEAAFLKFFLESAHMLKNLLIVCAYGCFNSMAEANSRVKALLAGKKSSKFCSVTVCQSALPEEAVRWNFQRGCDFSHRDPFALFARV